ncbi:molecular chaperone [Paraherbaspirillum soli]|uniref:Molecular chaperone n=1 Tax=Paraherbaspirillum soli TaxID=631222 RepID=A0ABW0M7L6_9BURK
MRLSHQTRRIALAIGLGIGLANAGAAASLSVNPIGFHLTPQRPSAVLQVRNAGADPVRVQVGAVDWSTDGRQEVLTDTDAVLLNPPIFALQPGQTQYVRFGLRHPANSAAEASYRLLVEEVPSGAAPASGLRTLLRVSIPVFIAPAKGREMVSWTLQQAATGPVLAARNEGNVHAKIQQIRLANSDSNGSLQITSTAYVLPGQHKEWRLESGKIQPGKVRLQIQTDKGEIEENLTLGADQVPGR